MRSGCRWSRCRRASAEHEAVEFHLAGRPRRSRLRRGNSSAVRRRGESVRRAPRRDLPRACGEARVPADEQAGAIARGRLPGRHGDRDERGAAAARARRQAGSGRPVARVGIGVAVNENAPLPDISTPEAFKRALLAARSVVYIDPKTGTSGKHVAEILQRLGIADEVNRKATLGQGGYITEPVGRGEIELGIHQISEILPVKGVRLAGPLPKELQKYTVCVAAPVLESQKKTAVVAFIAHLSAPQARARLAASGYSPPE